MTNPWIQIIRPKTLFASIGPVILGLALVTMLDLQFLFSPLLAFNTLLCAVLLQIFTNIANDYYDGLSGVDAGERLGPQRMTQSNLIPAKTLKRTLIILLGLIFLSGFKLMIHGGMPIIVIGISSMFFAWAYTAGPIPLSRFALGELFAFIYFGPMAVWGTFYIQTKTHSILPVLVGLMPGLLSASIMSINNLRDFDSDLKAGKKTLSNLLPKKWSRYFPLLFLSLALLIPISLVFKGLSIYLLSTLIPSLLFFKSWKAIIEEEPSEKFNLYLAQMGKNLFFTCLIFSLILLIDS